MGRIGKVEEDGTPTSVLASDPTSDINIELLVLLGRQAEAGLQELKQLQSSAGTPAYVVVAHERVFDRLQQVLDKVSEFGRTSSGDLYKRSAVQEIEALKEWAEDELAFSSDPRFKNNAFVQARIGFARTLLDILEEFI